MPRPRIKIDRGVPMPARPTPPGRKTRYQWEKMEVGDSFLFPRGLRGAHQQAAQASKKYGRTFRVRKTPDGFRCWRVE